MTSRRHVEVVVTALVEFATFGQWCPSCALPSVTVVPWVLLGVDGVSVAARGLLALCDRCGDVSEACAAAAADAQAQVDGDGKGTCQPPPL